MERSEWYDDDGSPAPLPAHERVWRHPSEIGAEAWARTEPPIAIGRALTATTGAVGVLLAGAMLLTLLPTHAGQPAVVSARSVVSVLPATDAESALAPDTTPHRRPDGAGPSTTVASVEPAALLTPPTYQVADDPDAAIAVSIGDLVVTTAAAAVGRDVVQLQLDDGTIGEALVVAVDPARGLALLAPHHAAHLPSFSLAESVGPGDVLTFGAGDDTSSDGGTALVMADGSIASTTPLESLREGTPLVDRNGDLVALLTHGMRGAQIVLVDVLDDLRWSLVHLGGRAGDQLGVALSGGRTPSLRIATLAPDGPAARAGLLVGDVIAAVNGVKVHHCDSLLAALAERRPGDTVVLTVRRDGDLLTVTVVTD